MHNIFYAKEFVKPDSDLVKPDKEYSIITDFSKSPRKGYELYIEPNGNKWYYYNGQKHRENAPAIIFADGHQVWYYHGKNHNLNGPVRIYSNGVKEYYIDNKEYEENEFWTVQKKCFKCHQIFNNFYDLKIHLEQHDDSKNMIEYIFKLIL